MNASYASPQLTIDDQDRLRRSYTDLMALCNTEVPAVQAAARAAVAHVAQALNGQGLAYELYSSAWEE